MTNDVMIRRTIEWIEGHLHEEVTAEDIAAQSGFSKFHFHRLFQGAVGMSFTEYLRLRRLTNAAMALIHTDERIIDIAMHFCFDSQEVFTRAFKKVYGFPPGQYRRQMMSLMKMKEEEQMEETLKGWFLSGSHPFNYEMGADVETVHQGKQSGYLKSKTVTPAEGEFATMMQQFKADRYRGKRMKLSAFLKTEDVKHMASLWMRVDSASEEVLQFDNMSDRPIQSTSNWNHYTIVLDIPENSAVISFGMILSGPGCIWADSVTFEEVDEKTPTTNLQTEIVILDEPVNLAFEES
ncbi:helix-turn-helix domain-containing protein [Jeotgalibacillus aurantiacus]|uniref:helix-turn-helix domain-containing protein n=1 Tax=Jeotgalibacillus aurantiacus TaxID=2763266 RepID=UPI001D0AD42C|nr:AraC family transcriptional regulator [Jeotgalibacillus aurantiacus]